MIYMVKKTLVKKTANRNQVPIGCFYFVKSSEVEIQY